MAQKIFSSAWKETLMVEKTVAELGLQKGCLVNFRLTKNNPWISHRVTQIIPDPSDEDRLFFFGPGDPQNPFIVYSTLAGTRSLNSDLVQVIPQETKPAAK